MKPLKQQLREKFETHSYCRIIGKYKGKKWIPYSEIFTEDVTKIIKELLTKDFDFYSKPENSIGILAYLEQKIKELEA